MKNHSLRAHLIQWISLPVMLASVLTLLIGFVFAWHEIQEVYDSQMAHSAKLILQIAKYEIVEKGEENLDFGKESDLLKHPYESKTSFRVWHNDELLARSWNTDNFSDAEAPPGFSDLEIDGKPWRFFVFIDERDDLKIEVAQRYAIRYELIGQLMISLIAPGIVFIPVIFLIVWIGVRKVLSPVVRVSRDVDKRSSDDLSPIQSEHLPQEVAPLILALNRLFARIEDSFRREREFTDHAAHELRTPLAAMKTQTQVLMKKAKDMPDCAAGLENLQASIDRASHLVDQLLSLARLQSGELPKTTVNLSEILKDMAAEILPRAEKKNITITEEITRNVRVNGHADSIAILLGNLLDNAVKYTPEGGLVHVSLTKDGTMDIADTGPGLSDEDKKRVFRRFVRVDKTGQTGSGLGLSIARWIADAHDIRIALLDNQSRGLRAHIQWNALP